MTRLAEAYDALAEAAAALALELRATASPDAPGATQAPSFEDVPFSNDWPEEQPATVSTTEARAHGSLTVCPAHGIAFLHGKNNTLFCPAKSDEPNWSNPRGYCTVTPKSAAAWLRQHA